MNDKTSRPAIKNILVNLNIYDTVIIGYPIWWGTNDYVQQSQNLVI